MARKKRTDIKLYAWTRKSCPQNCNAKDSCKRASGKMLPARFIQNIRTEPRQHTSFWSGEMSLTMHGRTVTYGAGGRCDVPAGTVHSARMGPQGCRYLIGER